MTTTFRVDTLAPRTTLTPADALAADFVREHRLSMELTPAQRATLADVLDRFGETHARVYLGLCAVDVGLVPRATDDSRERLRRILDAALQVWAGTNTGSAIGGDTTLDRLTAFARALKLATAGKPLSDDSIATLRGRVLARDVFERGTPVLPPLHASGGAATPALVAPGGPPSSMESIFDHPSPRRRDPAYDKIPGTQEPWSARRVAELIDLWMGGKWDGTKSEKQILDLLHGLHVDDRRAIAAEYCQRRAAHDQDFADPRGRPLAGDAALNALYRKLVRELDDNPLGETNDGRAIKAYFDPKNASGQLQATDVVMMGNAGAIERMLTSSAAGQISALDAALKQDTGKGLEAWLRDKLTGGEERRALFLAHAPRENGQVPVAYVRAFELREAVRGWNLKRGATDENAVFRVLHTLSRQEFLDVAAAYEKINRALWHDQVEGDGGQSGEVRATALYHRLHEELNDGGELWLQRLALAVQGIRFDEKAAREAAARSLPRGGVEPSAEAVKQATTLAEREHRAQVAKYVAVTFRLAGEGGMDQDDMVGVLGLVKPESERNRFDGVPSVGEARDVYRQFFGDRNMRMDVKRATDDKLVEKLAEVTLEGAGYNSAEAAALRIGQDAEQAYRALYRPDMPEAERARFLTDVRAAFKRRTGKDLGEHLAKQLGAHLEVNGRKLPSRAMLLLEHGVLTPAERLLFALYEPRGLLPFMRGPESGEVLGVLEGLSPLERLVAVHEFGRLIAKPVDLARGVNPLRDEIAAHLRSEDVALAKLLASVMPHDMPALAFQIAAYLDQHTDPEIDGWLNKAVGNRDEWIARNFGDADPRTPGAQRVGLAELRQLVLAAGGGPQFAAKVGVSTNELAKTVGNIVHESRERGLAQMLAGIFRSDADLVHDAARTSGAAVRDAELYLAEHGQLTPAHLERMARAEAEVMARVKERLAHSRQDGALVGAVGTGILVAAALAAGASPALVLTTGVVGKATLGDPRAWATNALEGGAMAMLATYAASLPPSVNLWLRSINEGLAAAVGGGFLGLQVGVGTGAVSWLKDGAPGFRNLFDRVMDGGTVGAVGGFVVGGALYYVQRAWNDLFAGRPSSAPVEGTPNPPTSGNRPPITEPGPGGAATSGNRTPITTDAGVGPTVHGSAPANTASATASTTAVWTQPGGVAMLGSAWRQALAGNAPAAVLDLLWAGRAQAAADVLRRGQSVDGQVLAELLADGRQRGLAIPETWPAGRIEASDLERLRQAAAQRAQGAAAR